MAWRLLRSARNDEKNKLIEKLPHFIAGLKISHHHYLFHGEKGLGDGPGFKKSVLGQK